MQKFTAQCQQDCLLMTINKEAFKLLQERKLRKQKEFLARFLVTKFPKFLEHTSECKLQD